MAPQFGRPPPDRAPVDRPCAFGVVERDGAVALVRIIKPEAAYHDLPGGAVDPGKTEAEALVREFGEETGLRVRPLALFARADQFMVKDDGRAVNNRCALFTAEAQAEDPALKIEEDHTLVWVPPHEALTLLRHDAHAWAVLAWLRRAQA